MIQFNPSILRLSKYLQLLKISRFTKMVRISVSTPTPAPKTIQAPVTIVTITIMFIEMNNNNNFKIKGMTINSRQTQPDKSFKPHLKIKFI